MPLSDREKRLLDEMEAALLTEDPRLVSALSADPALPSRKRIVAGAVLVLVGLATVVGGVMAKVPPVGIFGFIIALTGVITAISSFAPRSGSKSPKKPRTRSNISARLEQRWDNRGQEQ